MKRGFVDCSVADVVSNGKLRWFGTLRNAELPPRRGGGMHEQIWGD